MNTSRVALYCRQSQTREERSLSIEVQEEALRELADRRGWEVFGIYRDEDSPADDLDSRDDWLRLLNDSRHFDIVAAYDTTRLWRSVEYKIITFKVLDESGVHTVATLATDFPTNVDDNPEAEFLSTMMAGIAQLDNKLRAKKSRDTKALQAREGLPYINRIRPFGLTHDWKFEIPFEADITRELAKLVLEGKSLNGLANLLNDLQVPTANEKLWRGNTLRKVLQGPRLIGKRAHKGKLYDSQVIPKILDEATYYELQEKLAARQKGGQRKPKYLLSGLLRCGLCKTTLNAAPRRGGKYSYTGYSCPSRTTAGSKSCGKILIKAQYAEDYMIKFFLDVLKAGLLNRAIAYQKSLTDSTTAKVAQKKIDDLQARKRKLEQDFMDVDPQFALNTLKGINAELSEQALIVKQYTSKTVDESTFSGIDFDAWWKSIGNDERRTSFGMLIDCIDVKSAGKYRKNPLQFDENRLDIRAIPIEKLDLLKLAKLIVPAP